MILKVATVKYLNALPFLQALKDLESEGKVQLIEAAPSECSQMLKKNLVELALIPVGAISDFDELHIASRYCIACNGNVRTVKIFSEYVIGDLQQIILDPSSRSSNLLVQILCKEFWKRPDIIFAGQSGYDSQLRSGTIKIGDDVFNLENRFTYEYDLGMEWKKFTGLPFVFALWVSNRVLDTGFLELINDKFFNSLSDLKSIERTAQNLLKVDLNNYFEQNISYELDEHKQKGLLKFMQLAGIRNVLRF